MANKSIDLRQEIESLEAMNQEAKKTLSPVKKAAIAEMAIDRVLVVLRELVNRELSRWG